MESSTLGNVAGHPDGCVPPCVFWYNNRCMEMQLMSWKLLKLVLEARNQCVRVDILENHLWGPSGAPSYDALEAHKRKAAAVIRSLGYPGRLRIKGGWVYLAP